MWVPPVATECGVGARDQASLYRRRSTTPGLLHPRADRGVGGSRSGGFRHRRACGHLPHRSSILVAILAPQIFSWTLLLLSPSISPHSSAQSSLCMASVATVPPSFSLRHPFGSLYRQVPRTLEVCRNARGLRAVSGPQGMSWALGQRTPGTYCQGVPITGCVPLPDFLGTLELELTKVNPW